MLDEKLMKWGGVSALTFVTLLSISIITFWITGGIEFRAWVPLFSTIACFLLVATLAGYDFLAKSHYALARIGLGFGALSVLTLFLEAAVWGADRMMLRAGMAPVQVQLTPQLALFNSLHMMVLWLIGIWMVVWGMGFFRMPGKGKAAGTFMMLVGPFHLVDYVLARLGHAGLFADLWHLGSQIMLLSSFGLLGLILINASKETAP
jgi:hypothetical protein